MRPPEAGAWRPIPGYDGSSDSEDSREEEITSNAEERLRDIIATLGERWVNLPFIEFYPAPKARRVTSPGNMPQRVWGPRGPPPCFRVEHTGAAIVRETLVANGLCPTQDRDWLVQWSGSGMKDSAYQGLHEYQRVNHFPGSTELTRKDRMFLHLQEMKETFGVSAFDFVPETFVLPDQVEQFLECYERTKYLWIVKPHASSRGRGIFILRDLGELPLDEVSVVSRYVENPMLIQGLKFDLRLYVLVTGFDPLRAYVYREGLTRFASSPYSTEEEHLQDAYRHLTNYSINKSAVNFVENREVQADNVGHKWSLSALNKHLRCVGADIELMWSRIMDLIAKTLLSVEHVISSRTRDIAPHRANCFELYGFDVLVDSDLKPWLIEVNLSPSMQADSPLDWQVKSSLLCDAFNLVGVCHVDRQTVSMSRLRSKLLQVRRSSTLINFNRSSSFSGLQPSSSARAAPKHRGTCPNTSAAQAAPRGELGAAEETLGAPVDAHAISNKPVVLEGLTEKQLKFLAHSLKEVGRRHNFIRLYPTRSAVERYAPLTELLAPRTQRNGRTLNGHGEGWRQPQSHLLASVLFGPTPITSAVAARSRSMPTRPASADRAAANTGLATSTARVLGGGGTATATALRAGGGSACSVGGCPPGGVVFQSANATLSAASMEERREAALLAMEAVKAVGIKAGCRLALMEYLIRLSGACDGMDGAARARIAQSSSYARLSAFRVQLLGIVEKSGYENQDTPPRSAGCGGLVDELLSASRTCLSVLVRDVWASEAPGEDVPPAVVAPPWPPEDECVPWEQGLAELLPPTFARSGAVQRALEALPGLACVDLERLLQSSHGADGYSTLLEPFTCDDFDSRKCRKPLRRPSSGSSCRGTQDRRHAHNGPIGDLVQASKEDAGRPRRPPRPESRGGQRPECAQTPFSGSPQTAPNRQAKTPPASETVITPPSHHRAGSPQSPTIVSCGSRRSQPRPGEAPMNTAERVNSVLARAATQRGASHAEPPPKPSMHAHARSMPVLPELLPESFTPLRHRSSTNLKMQASRSERPLSTECAQSTDLIMTTCVATHPSNFSMDIEL